MTGRMDVRCVTSDGRDVDHSVPELDKGTSAKRKEDEIGEMAISPVATQASVASGLMAVSTLGLITHRLMGMSMSAM